MVTRRVSKSCCGKSAIVFTVEKPVRKHHVKLFTDAGFIVPASYINCGLLYAKKDGMVGTATFGICNLNVRCSGPTCEAVINQFESILAQIEKES
jgi:hypothetical protein